MSTKEKIIKILEENRGRPVSGQMLSQTIGVSRAAVNKAVNSLRISGFSIAASAGSGYVLSEKSDMISAPAIRAGLNDELQELPLFVYASVTSTNDTAKNMAGSAAFINAAGNAAVIIANEQTSGKGRLDRSFHSPADSGLYMSFLMKPSFDISRSGLLTTAASVAVSKAIEKLTDIEPQIKWVNDIFAFGKKVCGILTEAVTSFESGQIESVVIGIGVNCSFTKVPDNIRDIYDALYKHNRPAFRSRLAAEIINEFMLLTADLVPENFLPYYRSHSMVLNHDVTVYKQGFGGGTPGRPAHAVAIDDTGGLTVRYEDGVQETLTAGEISIRLQNV